MIGMHETRVVALYENRYEPRPKTIAISEFDLLHLCTPIFPSAAAIEGKGLLRGNCFANAARLTFEDGFETVFCYVVGSGDMVYPHALVRNKVGNHFEVTPGNDGTARYYAYCAVGLKDYESVLAALGTSTAEFAQRERYYMSLNEDGDLILPFTEEDRAGNPLKFPNDKFVVDVMSAVSGSSIELRD